MTSSANESPSEEVSARKEVTTRESNTIPFRVHAFSITKTYLYNFDPLKPHFYIAKLGITGVYIIFLISAQKHRLWVLVTESVLTSTHNLCFEPKYEKYQIFLSENFHVLAVKFSVYLNRYVFVMAGALERSAKQLLWDFNLVLLAQNSILTHLCQVDFSTFTFWTGSFSI